MLRYRLKKLALLLIGAAAVLLMLGVVGAIALTGGSATVTPLGNASSPRSATAQPIMPQRDTSAAPAAPATTQGAPAITGAEAPATGPASDAATTGGANGNAGSSTGRPSGARSTAPNGNATLVRTYSADEQQARQQAILAAYNCARTSRQLPPLTLDPALSRTAEASWTALHNGTRRIESLSKSYPLFNLVAFDDAVPAQRCTLGGFDASLAPALEQAHAIGIAAFPSQDDEGQDSPSALIIGK